MALIPSKRIRELAAKKELTEEEQKELDYRCKTAIKAINGHNDNFGWGIVCGMAVGAIFGGLNK